VRATAGREVEVADRDDADVGSHLGIAAKLDRGELRGVGEPLADREIVVDQVVREVLGSGELRLGDAAFRRQDWEAGGTSLSPWHDASLAHAEAVLKSIGTPKADSSAEYMVRGIRAEVGEAKKKAK